MGKVYQVLVNGLRSDTITIDLCSTAEQMASMSVLQLKERVVEKLPGNSGTQLENDSKLSDYGIQHKSYIQMVLRVHGGLTSKWRPPPSTTAAATAGT